MDIQLCISNYIIKKIPGNIRQHDEVLNNLVVCVHFQTFQQAFETELIQLKKGSPLRRIL